MLLVLLRGLLILWFVQCFCSTIMPIIRSLRLCRCLQLVAHNLFYSWSWVWCVVSCSHAPDLSAIPYVGKEIVQWVWGGFAVDNATLTRFFALHFLIRFVITAIVLIHLLFLHQTGSNNPLGLNKNAGKIPFHPYITVKDILFWCLASCSHAPDPRPAVTKVMCHKL
jgi:hypothetical protein